MLKKVRRLPSLAWKGLRRGAPVIGAVALLAAGAYAAKTLLLDDEGAAAPRLGVTVLPPGTFASAHPYAPYYVVPRKRFRDPSKLTRVARNNLITKPESAVSKGGLPGSPQIVRLSLRGLSDEPVTVDRVRARVISDARPLRGWFTAEAGCEVQPVRRAKLNLDSPRAATRYVGAGERGAKTLSLELGRADEQVIELQAATRRHRVAWVAELTVRNQDGDPATITVDDAGKPFRVTSERSSRSYRPIYGQSGIIGYARQERIFEGC
ncbi:MAG TPA: hypothetical protein VGV90_19170 [Solirubrobacteraceae bacterium]|nr:hypothetical protein [Solirubrobacteraceae bacterium]